jgi:UDP-N-acetylmuramate dehydrogenase
MACLENVLLSSHVHYRIGGPARFFCEARTPEEVTEVSSMAHREKLPLFVLGAGTNLIVSDAGFPGVVLVPKIMTLEASGTEVTVGAGVTMARLIEFCIERNLSGLEWAGGLPGTVGGAIRGNAGCFGGETKDIVRSVTSLDVAASPLKTEARDLPGCRFGYRTSIFKERAGEYIILSATLQMREGDGAAIRASVEEKIGYRTRRHPMEYPNAGSIFKNVPVDTLRPDQVQAFRAVIKTDPFPVVPTAFLIAEAGLAGTTLGGAQVSPKHPNFIVNASGATAGDVKELISLVKRTVAEKFGIALEEEVQYL